MLKHEFGAPNYGLSIVICITLICYIYGLYSAIISFLFVLLGIYILKIEVYDSSTIPRLFTICLTIITTCTLVIFLQSARKKLESHNIELQIYQDLLSESLVYQRNIATTMQQVFLPSIPEKFKNITISAAYEAGSSEAEIGGDFYDVLAMSEDELLIVIGDVSGKGIVAAKQAIGAKYGLRACILESKNPAEAMQRLNSILYLDPEFTGFVTLFAGILNGKSGQLIYTTGGHEPPLLFRNDADKCIELNSAGAIVGAFTTPIYANVTIDLKEGDALLFFTDGLSEARNNTDILGSDGLAKIMVANVCNDVDYYLSCITRDARNFSDGKFKDDAAAILLLVNQQ